MIGAANWIWTLVDRRAWERLDESPAVERGELSDELKQGRGEDRP